VTLLVLVALAYLFAALGCAAWSAHLAENRGRNPVPWGVLGLFTGLVGVLISALVQPTVAAEAERSAEVAALRADRAPIDGLAKLVELHRAGDLSDEEFVEAKRQLLGLG
jgi:hypothetical protein